MTDAPPVVAAKLRAETARTEFKDTVDALRVRLSPSTVAHKAWATTVDRSADAWDMTVERGTEGFAMAIDHVTRATETAVGFTKRKPDVVATGIATAIALLVGPKLVRQLFRPAPVKPVPTDPPRLRGPIPHLEIRP